MADVPYEQSVIRIVSPDTIRLAMLGSGPGVKGDLGDTGPAPWVVEGPWDTLAAYVAGPPADVVTHADAAYVALADSTGVEPGVTTGWETSWAVLPLPVGPKGDPGDNGDPGLSGSLADPYAMAHMWQAEDDSWPSRPTEDVKANGHVQWHANETQTVKPGPEAGVLSRDYVHNTSGTDWL